MEDFSIWEELSKVIESVDMSKTDSDADFVQFSSNLQKLAVKLHLAMTEVHLVVIPNVFSLAGLNKRYKYSYDSKPWDFEHSIQIHHELIRNQHIQATFYPIEGHVWTKEEERSIRLISSIISTFMTNGSLAKILQNTPYIDVLTGLINSQGIRRVGNDLYENDELKNYTAVYFNLKNFQYINKKYGVRNGDNIICQFALYIYRFATDKEYVSRLGGDNFIVLILKSRLEEFLQYLAEVNIDVHYQDRVIPVAIRARFGIYDIRESDRLDNVLENATAAFVMARRTHNDMVTFTEEMLQSIMDKKHLIASFPKLLRDGEMVPYYQPKVNIETNELCGCEALVRWNRDGEIIISEEFLPAIESDSIIRELDMYMLERVCADIRDWLDRGIEPVRVSINFSKMNLQNPNLGDDTVTILSKYNIDPKYLEIELTETSGYEDMMALAMFIKQMHEIGVNVAMDDFGTGYSSLNIFKDFDFDVIKLDKSFVDNIEHDIKKDEVIIKNIVKMLTEINVDVVAEGVETQKQLNFLKNTECKIVQGFIFDEALQHDVFEEKLKNRKYEI